MPLISPQAGIAFSALLQAQNNTHFGSINEEETFPGKTLSGDTNQNNTRPNSLAQSNLGQIRGLNKEELIALIGPPTRSSSSSASGTSETLFYGSSQVLFVNGLVASWSDTGELRMRVSHFAPSRKVSWEKWPNPWTPPS